MLGTSLESFILLRVTVFVYGGGEVAAVNAELVPRPQLGAAASRDVLRVAALLMTIDDFRNGSGPIRDQLCRADAGT